MILALFAALGAVGLTLFLAGVVNAFTAHISDYPGSAREGCAMMVAGAVLLVAGCVGLL